MPVTNFRLFVLYCFLGIATVLQSCAPPQPGVYKNGHISKGRLNDFHQLNDRVFAALKNNRPDEVEDMLSRDMLEGAGKQKIQLLAGRTQSFRYTVYDEFYVVDTARASHEIKSSIKRGVDEQYTFNLQTLTPETYVALLVPTEPGEKWMVTLIYRNFDYGWHIDDMQICQYTYNGKTTPQLYRQALQRYEADYLVDAFNIMTLVAKSLRPSVYQAYELEDDMVTFYTKVKNEYQSRYTLPYTIPGVPTNPQIIHVFELDNNEGTFPMIYYLTKIKLSNYGALKKENDQIKRAIGKAMPGIDKGKKYLLFSAFNQKISTTKSVPSVDFSWKLE